MAKYVFAQEEYKKACVEATLAAMVMEQSET